MKLRLPLFVALPIVLTGAGHSALFLEDFESVTPSYTLSFTDPGGDNFDYFRRTDGSDISESFTGADGSFFAAMDTDAAPGGGTSPATISWTGIDITGVTDFVFSASWAEGDDGSNQDWDSPDFVLVEYQIDGGGYLNLFALANDGSTFNSAPSIDTDFNGVGDGAEITSAFTKHSTTFTGSGSSLDLRITVALDSGDEDIAFDNISLAEVPEPSIALLGGLGVLGLLRRRR